MKAKLTSLDYFKTKQSHNSDCIWILKEIKGITYSFEGQGYIFLLLDDARTNYYAYTLGPDDTIVIYLEHFTSFVEVLVHYGGPIGKYWGILDSTDASLNATQRAKIARDRTLVLALLKQADRRHFGDLWHNLENQFTRGNDQCPINLTAAYSLLVNFKPPVTREAPARRHIPRNPEPPLTTADKDGMTFNQAGEIITGIDGITRDTTLCFLCQNKGHYTDKCPNGANAATSDAVQLLQADHPTDTHVTDDVSPSIEKSSPSAMNPSPLPGSTVLVFKNPSHLSNIRRSSNQLKVYTKGGTQLSLLIGDIKNFGTVWYNPDSLANIFSLAAVRKLCCITMDTDVQPALCVHCANGSVMKLIEYKTGLYIHDAAVAAPKTNVAPVVDYSFVTTVADNN